MTENEAAAPERFGPFDLLKIWRKLQDLVGDFDLRGFLAVLGHLWPPPDWDNSESVCGWCRSLIGATEMCAELTATKLDDEAIAALATIVRNDEAWAAWYTLFHSFLNIAAKTLATSADRERAAPIARSAGVDTTAVLHSAHMMSNHAKWLRARPLAQE